MLRIAAVRYINALPLIYGLSDNPSVKLSFETPAVCYQKLIEGAVDVGLIPVIGTQTNSRIRALKGLGIGATTRSESVLVIARKPLDRVERVLTDTASMTSVTLLKIILREKYHNSPQFHPGSPENIYEALRQNDAALVIGDQAILTEKTDFDHYDLAAEWYSLVKLPFVFAVWGCSRYLEEAEQKILQDAYTAASQDWTQIYDSAQRAIDVKREFLERYYNVNLHFRLTRGDYEGLLKFFELAANLQFIPKIRKDIWL